MKKLRIGQRAFKQVFNEDLFDVLGAAPKLAYRNLSWILVRSPRLMEHYSESVDD